MDSLGAISVEGTTLTTMHAGCIVAVRFARDLRGRWLPVVVTLDDPGGIGAEVLRTFPMRQLEAVANSDRTRSILDAGAAATGEPTAIRRRAAPVKLDIPEGPGRKPDNFYRKVAAAYQYLATTTRAPAAELAKANKVPVTTAHRWVKEARVRGLLTAGQKGRAS